MIERGPNYSTVIDFPGKSLGSGDRRCVEVRWEALAPALNMYTDR